MNSRFIIIVLGELWLYDKLLCITHIDKLIDKLQEDTNWLNIVILPSLVLYLFPFLYNFVCTM